MTIIKNPRLGKSFENPNIKCSICKQTNTYLLFLDPYKLCKSCLTNFIKEIDIEITGDIIRDSR